MDHSHHHQNQNIKEKENNKEEHFHKSTGHDHKTTTSQPGNHKNHHNDHGAHHEDMVEDFKKRFWISLILTIPVMLLSEMIQHWLGIGISFTGDKYILFALSTIIFFYGGWPFLKGLVDEIKRLTPGMMTLIGLAITVAYVYSTAVVFGLKGMDFYWELATLIDIMLVGHWLEMKSIMGASRALELLVQMMPSEAHLVKENEIVNVKIEELQKGDLILIKPGEKVPADGEILDGESSVDESMLTGESKPASKTKGQKVIGGSINQNGSLRVKVLSTGKDSYLSKVINLVQDAQKTKSKTQHLADKAAAILTFVALGAGFLTLAVWLYLGKPFDFALERMVTVMVISCPHALGLAVPLVVAISTAVSARNGLLIRNRTAFENSRKITTIVFDKTGTLTQGSHEVSRIQPFSDKWNEVELLRLASGVEQNSEHHISKGIIKKAKKENIQIPASSGFNYMPGQGLEGEVEGKHIQVAGPNYLKENKIQLPEIKLDEAIETVVYVIINKELAGYITLADQVREDSFDAVKTLKEHGIKNLLLTGDNEQVAKSVSDKLKMDGFIANVLPHQKQDKIKELQNQNEFVAMTGDGVNDAPALAQADVGIAVGSGTDIAAETADIILVNSNPKDIANLILFGRATYRKMLQNLIWATGYNVVAIPLAAGVLYNYGIVLSPAIGAVLMSFSTIIVAINAQLLKTSIK